MKALQKVQTVSDPSGYFLALKRIRSLVHRGEIYSQGGAETKNLEDRLCLVIVGLKVVRFLKTCLVEFPYRADCACRSLCYGNSAFRDPLTDLLLMEAMFF